MDAANILRTGKDDFHQLTGHASAWVGEMPQYARRIELREVGDVTTIYKAWAEFGTSESADDWMIVKIVLDGTTGLDVTEGMAGGDVNLFNFAWTGRAGHTYS